MKALRRLRRHNGNGAEPSARSPVTGPAAQEGVRHRREPALTCRPAGSDRRPGQALRAQHAELAPCNDTRVRRAGPPRGLQLHASPAQSLSHPPRRSPSGAPPEPGSGSASLSAASAKRGLFRRRFSSGASGGARSSPSPTMPLALQTTTAFPSALPFPAAASLGASPGPKLPPRRGGGGPGCLISRSGPAASCGLRGGPWAAPPPCCARPR